METTPAFAAVIFDLDGTLVATDQFWIPAARAATRRVFAERGITLEQPSGNEWMRLVGYPMRVGLRIVLPDLDDDSMDALHIACIEEEEATAPATWPLAAPATCRASPTPAPSATRSRPWMRTPRSNT